MKLTHWCSTTSSNPWQRLNAPASPEGDGAAMDLVIIEERDQRWDGFGACFNELGWEALLLLPEENRMEMIRELFAPEGKFRFNVCRLPIGANDYAIDWYSHNETPTLFRWRNSPFSVTRSI